MLLATAAAAAALAAGELRATPFGLVSRECVHAVPSGTYTEELRGADGMPSGVLVRFPNGTQTRLPPCAGAAPAVNARWLQREQPARRPQLAAEALTLGDAPNWQGWPRHYWFGLSYAYWSGFPANEGVFSFNATWRVPELPPVRTANASSPWPWAPTISLWPGLQGPTVLQPVMEYNGLVASGYDAVSWNCCPAGMTFHGPAVPAKPGDTLVGTMVRLPDADASTSSASAAGGPKYVYETVTALAGGGPASSLRSAMGVGEPGWVPNWLELITEGWFVSSCSRLPCGPYNFMDVAASVVPAGAPYNTSTPLRPRLLGSIPWVQEWTLDNSTTPAQPTCGYGTHSDNQTRATLDVNCAAPHATLD